MFSIEFKNISSSYILLYQSLSLCLIQEENIYSPKTLILCLTIIRYEIYYCGFACRGC